MSQTVLADRQEKDLRARHYKKLMVLRFVASGGHDAGERLLNIAGRLSRVADSIRGR